MKIQVTVFLALALLSGIPTEQIRAYDNFIEAGKTAGLVVGAGALYSVAEFTAMHLQSRSRSDSYFPSIARYKGAFLVGTCWGVMTGLPMAGLVAGSRLQISDVVPPLAGGLGLLFLTSRVARELGYRNVYKSPVSRMIVAQDAKLKLDNPVVDSLLDMKARMRGLSNSDQLVERGLKLGGFFLTMYTAYQCYQKA